MGQTENPPALNIKPALFAPKIDKDTQESPTGHPNKNERNRKRRTDFSFFCESVTPKSRIPEKNSVSKIQDLGGNTDFADFERKSPILIGSSGFRNSKPRFLTPLLHYLASGRFRNVLYVPESYLSTQNFELYNLCNFLTFEFVFLHNIFLLYHKTPQNTRFYFIFRSQNAKSICIGISLVNCDPAGLK